MNLNIIRSIIFFTAAFFLLIYPKKVIYFQKKVLKIFKIKKTISEKATTRLGYLFLIIALILLAF